jgi:hypothetical protein
MIDLIENIGALKKVYVLDTGLWNKNRMEFNVYSVTKLDRLGVNKWYVELKNNAIKTTFPKALNSKGFMLRFKGYPDYLCYADAETMIKDYCFIIRTNPDKNKTLTKKMTTLYPQYFV